MPRCWAQRGCDEEMQSTCAHPMQLMDNCPTKCAFAHCDRPQNEFTNDPALLFDPTIDRSVAIKDDCLLCGFFLSNAPKIGESIADDDVDDA